MTALTFTHLHRMTEEELTYSMRGVSRLFIRYQDERRDAMAGVWGSILEALDLEWDRREAGDAPQAVTVDFATLSRLTHEEIQMISVAARGVKEESSRAGRVGRADLYGRVLGALEDEMRMRDGGLRTSYLAPSADRLPDAGGLSVDGQPRAA